MNCQSRSEKVNVSLSTNPTENALSYNCIRKSTVWPQVVSSKRFVIIIIGDVVCNVSKVCFCGGPIGDTRKKGIVQPLGFTAKEIIIKEQYNLQGDSLLENKQHKAQFLAADARVFVCISEIREKQKLSILVQKSQETLFLLFADPSEAGIKLYNHNVVPCLFRS